MYDVLCAGLTCCDLIFSHLEKFPEVGKEVAGSDFIIKAGGAANTPVALSRLGAKTLYATMIGNDIPGDLVYQYMEKTGLDMSAVIREESIRTSVSAVLSVGYERGFASYFADFSYSEMERQIERYMPCCNHIHTYIGDCMNMDMIGIARKYGKTLSVDTAWDETLKVKDIKEIIKNSTIFLTNELEACSITDTECPEDALKILKEYTDYIVIKLGTNGSMISKGNDIFTIPAVKEINVVDTTGAGDLYGAGFIYGYLNGWDIIKTAEFASASGGLAVTFYGGMDERYTKENVLNLVNKIV